MSDEQTRCRPWNHTWYEWVRSSGWDQYRNVRCRKCGKHKLQRVKARYER